MGKSIWLLNAIRDKNVHHWIPHRLIKESWKNSTAIKSYDGNKKKRSRERVSETGLVVVVTWPAATPVVVGSNPGGTGCFFQKKFQFFSQKKIFPGVFIWFRRHKKVSLTKLEPRGRRRGVRPGLSQALGGLQKCLFCAKLGQFRGSWCKIVLAFLASKISY